MPEIAHSPYPTSAAVAASRIQSSRRTIDATATASSRRFRSPRALVSTASITLRRHPNLGWMHLEVRLEDLEGRGGGCGSAVAAVLDQGADRDRRRVGGRVPAPPGLIELPGEAGDALELLGRSSLACDGFREGAEDGRRGPAGAVRRLQQPLAHDVEVERVDLDNRRRRGCEAVQDTAGGLPVADLFDIGGDVRLHEPAAVCDQGVEARHLERRHEQVLLPDRELNRVARLPQPVDPPLLRVCLRRVGLLAPFRGRQQPRQLAWDVDPRRAAEAKARGPLLERVPPRGGQLVEAVAEVVEVGVAGSLQRRGHRHLLTDERVPVLERAARDHVAVLVVDVVEAGASDRLGRRHKPFLERRERGHRLEGGARRIEAGDRAVEARVVVLAGYAGVEQRRELLWVVRAEDAGLERWVRGEREN